MAEVKPEAQLQKLVMDWLRAEGILAFRMNVGAHVADGFNGKRRFIRFGVAGMADVLAIRGNGLAVWIELKAPRGRQTPEQLTEERRVRRLLADAVRVYWNTGSLPEFIWGAMAASEALDEKMRVRATQESGIDSRGCASEAQEALA